MSIGFTFLPSVHEAVSIEMLAIIFCDFSDSRVDMFKINEALVLSQGAIIKNAYLAAASCVAALINSV